MHPYFRLAALAARSLTSPRLGPLDEARLAMRVLPGDVELTRMNNGRYVTLMDLGRLDLTFRCGLLGSLVKNRWFPLVASLTTQFRRSLRIGQAYDLLTRLAAFDDKYWYIEQRFVAGGRVVAEAYLKGVFRGPKGNVRIPELLAAAGHAGLTSPPLSDAFRAWLQSDEAMRRATGSVPGDAAEVPPRDLRGTAA
jgi:acyl-CoA thioesterase FadM